MNGTPWTEEEEALVGTDTDGAIAEQLGRTPMAVRNKRRALGIAPPRLTGVDFSRETVDAQHFRRRDADESAE